MKDKIPNRGRANYTAISLPKDLMNDVDEFISRYPRYRSLAEFTKISIIEKMQKEVVFSESLSKEYSYDLFKKNNVDNIQESLNKIDEMIKKNHSELSTDTSGIINMLVGISKQLGNRP